MDPLRFQQHHYNLKNISKLFDVSISTIHVWIKKGKIPEPIILRGAVGKQFYWKNEQIDEILKKMNKSTSLKNMSKKDEKIDISRRPVDLIDI